MVSRYVLQDDDKTFCPVCHGQVKLLCRLDGKMKPWFYICFKCAEIAELGRGRVDHV
jgi:hypothetical protein